MSVHRRARIAVTVLLLGVGTYVGLLVVANAQLERLLPQAIAHQVGGRDADLYAVQIGSVHLAPSLNGLTVESLTVTFDPAAANATSEPALVRTAILGRVRMSGVRLIPLVRGRGIFVAEVEIDGPKVELDFAAIPTTMSPVSELAVDSARRPAATDRGPPEASLGRLRVSDGSIVVTRTTARGRMTSSLRGLDLELTGIAIDEIALANPVRALTSSRVSIAFDSARHMFDDSLYVTTVRRVRAESQSGLAEIGQVQLTPTLEAAPFFERLSERSDRITLEAGPIHVGGLDFAGYVRGDSIHVRMIDVNSLELDVHSNINLDWGERAQPCRYHEPFSAIAVPLRIDTVRVSDGLIRYSELAKGSVSPGELTLEALNGTIVNVNNDLEAMTPTAPAVARVTAKLFGEAPMQATLSYPLLSPTLDFRVEASAGPMDLVTANRFATNVTGLDINRGWLDTLWLSAEVRNGRAEGRVEMQYRDLHFRLVDKRTGRAKAWHAVAGLAAKVLIRSNNPGRSGDTPRDGRIDYRCGDQDMVFFEFLVHLLANGLKRIVL